MQKKELHELGKTELLTIIQEQQKQIENLKETVKDLDTKTKSSKTQKEAEPNAKASKKLNNNSDKIKQTAKLDEKTAKTVNGKTNSKKQQNITNEKNKEGTYENKEVNINSKKSTATKKETTASKATTTRKETTASKAATTKKATTASKKAVVSKADRTDKTTTKSKASVTSKAPKTSANKVTSKKTNKGINNGANKETKNDAKKEAKKKNSTKKNNKVSTKINANKKIEPVTALVVVNNSLLKYSSVKVLLRKIKLKALSIIRTLKANISKYNNSLKNKATELKATLIKKCSKLKEKAIELKTNTLKKIKAKINKSNNKTSNAKKGKNANKKQTASKKKKEEQKKKEKIKERIEFVKKFFYASLVIVAIAIISASYLFKILQVNGSSMEPTLRNGEILITSHFFGYKKGDMIAFYYNDKVLIKRVIGLEGDTIFMDDDGTIYVNNEKLEEDYVEKLDYGKCNITFPYIVPNDSVFVLGDNREFSVDSRNSSIGCIRKDNIVGKIKIRLFPFRIY